VPTGHLVFKANDGSTQAVAFDLDRLQITGDDAVTVLPDGDRPVFSDAGTMFYAVRPDVASRRMMRVDREGVAQEIDPGWTGGGIFTPALSHRGSRLALSIDQALRVKVLDRGPLTPLTSDRRTIFRPVWSADDRMIAYIVAGLPDSGFVVRADGVGGGQPLISDPRGVAEVLWSPDQQWIVYRTSVEDTQSQGDIMARRLGADTSIVLAADSSSELTPALSPDGRWLAYASDESGTYEIFVRPFPNVRDGKWPVSTNGGIEPRWSHSGKELFFRNREDAMVAVEIETTPGFTAGTQRVLFSTVDYENDTPFHRNYDVLPDDKGFVMIEATSRVSYVLVLNWFEELKQRMKVGP
jgi:Tol biopolymer transport system component